MVLNNKRLFRAIVFLAILLSTFLNHVIAIESTQEEFVYNSNGKRDPFVPIVDLKSGIRSAEDLLGRPKEVVIPIKLELKAIIWDESRPLVVLNGKVLTEQDVIPGTDVKVLKINRDHIIVNYGGKESIIKSGGSNEK